MRSGSAHAISDLRAADQAGERARSFDAWTSAIDRRVVAKRFLRIVINEDFERLGTGLPLRQGHLPLVAIIDHIPGHDDGDLHTERTA